MSENGKSEQDPGEELVRHVVHSRSNDLLISRSVCEAPRSTISGGATAELTQLAAVATEHPDDGQARRALARNVSDLLNLGQDAIIDEAIRNARGPNVARTLRQAAEAASERISVTPEAVDVDVRLVAIPIIVAFDDCVPESHIDGVLAHLTDASKLARIACVCAADIERAEARLPQLLALDDAVSMPLSTVRALATRLAERCPDDGVRHATQADRALKRSTTFVRFALGRRVSFARNEGAETSTSCSCLERQIKRTLKRCLPTRCRVQLQIARPFHEALYTGMWSYQETRLKNLALERRTRLLPHRCVSAHLVLHGTTYAFEMTIGFVAGDGAVDRRAYRLRSRPTEDAEEVVTRVRRCLATADVPLADVIDGRSDEHAGAPAIGRHPLQDVIAVPI